MLPVSPGGQPEPAGFRPQLDGQRVRGVPRRIVGAPYGLTEALAIAMGQEIAYDEMGNVKTGTLMDFFLPTAWETPNGFPTGQTWRDSFPRNGSDVSCGSIFCWRPYSCSCWK